MSQIFELKILEKNKINSLLSRLDKESLKKNKALVKKNGTAKLTVNTDELGIDLSLASKAAMNVVRNLQDKGYKAYLVGGCIRDLLLGKKPKDFDVSTNATPEQVHKVFRGNSRIIGRRFKIVHVIFGGDNIIEVTTFRTNKEPPKHVKATTRVSVDSGMLIRDNVYGNSIVEDSLRRDFTINALYLDPLKKEIYDFNGGLYDMINSTIDIIGDPQVRYAEDPVRMIRALRFSAKLGFKISKRTSKPIFELKYNLLAVSNARMFEEVNKLFLSGHGLESFNILKEYRIIELLFPGIADYLNNQNYLNFIEYSLSSSDKRYAENKRNMPHFLYAVMLFSVFNRSVFELKMRAKSLICPLSTDEIVKLTLDSVFKEQDKVTAIPMVVADNIKSIWRMQINLLEYTDNLEKADKIYQKIIFRAAFDFLTLRARFEPFLAQCVDFWTPYYEKSKALADKRKKLNEEQRRQRFKKKKEKLSSADLKKSGKGFDRENSLERKKQLERAKAWRKSMNLEI